MAKSNPVVSRRRAGIVRPGGHYLKKPALFEHDLNKAHSAAIARLSREIRIFLRSYGLNTRGQTVIDQPSYKNKLEQQFKRNKAEMEKMSPSCHGAILIVDDETSDLRAILTGKDLGPGLRKIVTKYYKDDPARSKKTKILLKVLQNKFFDILASHGFTWKKLAPGRFYPKDFHHYKSGSYRVMPLWIDNLKATGVRLRPHRRRRHRRRPIH